jgi:hypothetical protein
MWVASPAYRLITTLRGVCRVRRGVRSCRTRYRQASRPEAEGRWALPHGECGLDLITLVGTLRSREHRSLSEIHRAFQDR